MDVGDVWSAGYRNIRMNTEFEKVLKVRKVALDNR